MTTPQPFVPMTKPVSDQDRQLELTHHLNHSVDFPYKSPVEAVPGVGGIAGVQAEE